MTLHAEGDHVRGVLVVDSPRTYGELQQQMPALTQRMADSGVDLRRLEIVLDPQPSPSSSDGLSSMLRDDQGQGAGDQQGDPGGGPRQADGPAGDAEQAGPAAEAVQRAYQVSDDSINVWI
jgi:flagellar hook-length control protein FliK